MEANPAISESSVFERVLLGCAVGDALGLPSENLSPQKIRTRWKSEWKMRLVFGWGMISDDTEHTLMVAQTLLSHDKDSVAFQRALAWKFRWWFLGLPGGVGFATAKACIRMWLGLPLKKCGVNSGGSGPAMRSAIIGAYFADDSEQRRKFVEASSCLTHRGWQAQTAALAIAECAAVSAGSHSLPTAQEVIDLIRPLSTESEWQNLLEKVQSSLSGGHDTSQFAQLLGLKTGVTGYALHVVPVAIFSWLRYPGDFRKAMIAALECGGDTDTVGAILGSLAGLTAKEEIPKDWVDAISEWPRSVGFMKKVAARLAEQKEKQRRQRPVPYFWPAILLRNLFFLLVVLTHGFRRLFP